MEKDKQKIIDFISELKSSNKLIIVEGKKDKTSLKKLGISNYIVTLSKKPLFEVMENISKITDQTIILTDFDKKGKELYRKLNTGLQKLGVKVDYYFREFLQKNTKLSHIEGIASYIKNLKLDVQL